MPMLNAKPILTFTRQQVRAVDAQAAEQFGLPGLLLMGNASRAVAKVAMNMLQESKNPVLGQPVLVLCGGGNNGGDGLGAARHLHNAGVDITIVLTSPIQRYQGDAKLNLQICQAMQLPILQADNDPLEVVRSLNTHSLIIDCLLGTGLTAAVRSPIGQLINWVNNHPPPPPEVHPVLSVDIPSGLDCDTGKPWGNAIKATCTITFVGLKQGFLEKHAHPYTGKIVVADIGAPDQLVQTHGRQIAWPNDLHVQWV